MRQMWPECSSRCILILQPYSVLVEKTIAGGLGRLNPAVKVLSLCESLAGKVDIEFAEIPFPQHDLQLFSTPDLELSEGAGQMRFDGVGAADIG